MHCLDEESAELQTSSVGQEEPVLDRSSILEVGDFPESRRLNFYNELAWLTVAPFDPERNPQKEIVLSRSGIRMKTATFRHIGDYGEYLDKDLSAGDSALFTWSEGPGCAKRAFAVSLIRSIIDAPLSVVVGCYSFGHERYGDGSLQAFLSLYRQCYPDREMTESSVFRVYQFRVVKMLLSPEEIWQLWYNSLHEND